MPPQQEQQSERDWTAFPAPGKDVATINEFIKFKMKEYEEAGFKDVYLWEEFIDDFESFTEDTFKSANQTLIRKLRIQLRKYGVWVKKERRGTAAKALYQTLIEEDLAPWSETEIRECLQAGEVFDSRRIDYILNNGGKTPAATPSMPTPSMPTPSITTDIPEHVAKPERSRTEQGTEQPPEQQQRKHGKELEKQQKPLKQIKKANKGARYQICCNKYTKEPHPEDENFHKPVRSNHLQCAKRPADAAMEQQMRCGMVRVQVEGHVLKKQRGWTREDVYSDDDALLEAPSETTKPHVIIQDHWDVMLESEGPLIAEMTRRFIIWNPQNHKRENSQCLNG